MEDANRESRDLLIELKQQEKLTALHEKRANEKIDELKKQLDAFKEQFSRRLDEAKNDESLIELEKQRHGISKNSSCSRNCSTSKRATKRTP